MLEVKEVWTDVLRNDCAKDADRLKVGGLLARAAGEFAGRQKTPVTGRPMDTDGSETAQEQQQFVARIVLPWNGRSPFNAVETDDGKLPILG